MTKKMDWGWVSRELHGAKATQPIQEAVVGLLECTVDLVNLHDLTDEERETVIEYLTKLLRGYSIALKDETERWGPVRPGDYRIGDTIRVRDTAYEGERGTKNNGRRGRVVAARDGFVLCVYDEDNNADLVYRHLPEKLQRLV